MSNKIDELYAKIEKDRELLETAAVELRSKIKDIQEHVLAGSVLSKYIDSLSKINDQLILLNKMKEKNNEKEKVSDKSQLDAVRKELENDNAIGTTIKGN